MSVNKTDKFFSEEDHFLRRMALVAVYEDDENLINELEKRGIKGGGARF